MMGPVVDYYEARYRAHGEGARGMDWRDEASQRLRFERLVAHLDLAGSPRLVDVGCGNGELLSFLTTAAVAVDYLGIDVAPAMVEACRRRHGDERAVLASTADLGRLGPFDYAVVSGTFNVKQDVPASVWARYVRRAIGETYASCRRGVAFNVMTTAVDHRYPHLYYMSLQRVAEIAAACGTRRFHVDHAYPLYEMTVTLLRPEPR